MTDIKLPILFRYRILWHIFFWVIVYLSYVIAFGGYMGRYRMELLNNLVLTPVRMLAVYSFIYLILPIAMKQKRFLLFSFLTIVHAMSYSISIGLTLKNVNLFPEVFDYSKLSLFFPSKILGTLYSNYAIIMFAATVVIFKKWYINEQQRKNLFQEKLEAELSLLKSQIHPHFLFNTLNNLYALTLIQSKEAPDIVLKLSGLLDYMIYKSNDRFVSLDKELQMLESYIELEKLRYNKRLDFDYQLKGEPGSLKIAPLIMLPFIENSFKHGAGNDRTNPKIRIKIEIGNDCLTLQVVNSIRGEKKKDESLGEGIGLKNVRRRLELIYPDDHKLEIRESEIEFEVNLEICSIHE